ncbi:GNAT family N-acetyltransferase [Leuconostoc mesenteroides]|uniref:GNAT family N-acetyltransferase n=1 Tax=Leuconostoc mesenteroides TaxID=1245 RepID=UPI002362C9D7|nr:GNAT family N-acetyltransferase [Leuconostoc mesenteroides]
MMNVRTVKLADAPTLLNIYKPYVERTTSTFEYNVPTIQDFEDRIANTLEKYPYIVIEEDNTILGYAYAHEFNSRGAYKWTVEISAYVSQEARSRGIGKMLYSEIENILKKQNVVHIIACITEENETSKKFHERMGYENVGLFKKIGFKSGKWLDNFWMQKTLCPSDQPKEFVPFSSL